MKNAILAAACLLAVSASGALAQSSQGKAGSDNGPTSNSTTTNGTGQPGMAGSSGPVATGATTGAAAKPDASQQGAPTAASTNAKGDSTEPGKVKDGATR